MLKRTRSGTIAPFSFPPHGHPIRWNFDMKEILTLEFQQLAKREKKIPYYRGKTSVRPRPGTEPLSDSEDDGEDEVDDDAAMTSDISDDESATGKNDEDMSSSESSESEEEVITFSSSQGTTEVFVTGSKAARAGTWALGYIREFSAYDLRPRRVTVGRTLLNDIIPPRFSLTRGQVLKAGLRPFDPRGHPTPIVDSHSCIVAVVVPSPTDVSGWHAGLREATDVFDRAAGYADYSHLEEPVLNWGVEFGGPRGAMPQNIKHNLPNCVEVALLMQSEGVQDIAGWQNTVFHSFGPKLYNYCENAVDLVFRHDSELRRIFPGAFAAAEFNLGGLESSPRIHDRDLLHGWRALTSLGKYNSRYGGDIILWDEGLLVRFPPGSTILFPAALMRYSFVAVRDGESQYTFSQYTSGGLHRFIANGYLNELQVENTVGNVRREMIHVARGRRMVAALSMYSVLGEFLSA